MNTFIIILLTLIILLAIATLIYISLYTKIMFSKMKIDEAQEVIEQELENRYELIMKIKKTIEKNTKKDLKIFNDLEKAKQTNITSFEFDKIVTKAITTIYLIKNDYPKLKEKKEFVTTLRKLKESDNKIDAAKSFYNKNNENLIELIKKFPTNIIALIKGIKIQKYYESKEIFNEIDDGIKI